MLELNFNPFPELTTERLLLRKPVANDVDAQLFLRSDAEVMKYIDRPPLKSREEAAPFLQKIIDNIDNNLSLYWAICFKDSPEMVGNIMLWQINTDDCRAEIGYSLHPAHQNQGIMNEAMTAVLQYAFNDLKLHSIEANVKPDNTASRMLLEKHNFIREAYFKENYFFNGKFQDSTIYSLLTPHR